MSAFTTWSPVCPHIPESSSSEGKATGGLWNPLFRPDPFSSFCFQLAVIPLGLLSDFSQCAFFSQGCYGCDEMPWLKAPWAGKVFFGLYFHITAHHLKDTKAGTWRQTLKQKPWRNAACWLDRHDFLSLSDTIRELLSRVGTTHGWLGPPTSIIH